MKATATPSDRRARQPIDSLTVDDALLKMATVVAVTGGSPTSVYRWLAAGSFPQPIRLGARCTRWRAGDVREWLRAQAAGTTA